MDSNVKRIVAAMVILVAAALIVVPRVIGAGIENSTAAKLMEMVPAEARSQISIEQTDFESSWFNSTAQFEVGLTAVAQQDLKLVLNLAISHGPFFFTSQGLRLGMAYADISPSLDNLASITLPLELPDFDFYLLAGFDQSLEAGMSLGSTDYESEQGHVLLEGLEASFALAANQSARMVFAMDNLDIEIANNNIAVQIPGVSMDSHTENLANIAATSEASLEIPSVVMESPVQVEVSGISIDSRVGQSVAGTDQIDMYQRLEVANVESELPIRSVNWVSEINEIHDSVFTEYSRLLGGLQASISSGNTANPGQLNEIGQELVLLLVQNNLVFKNLMEANLYGGDHRLDLEISWPGIPTLTNIVGFDINELVNALTVKLTLSLDERAAMQSPIADFVTAYVTEGLLLVDNGTVELLASLQDGNLIVNDENLPLDQFFSN